MTPPPSCLSGSQNVGDRGSFLSRDEIAGYRIHMPGSSLLLWLSHFRLMYASVEGSHLVSVLLCCLMKIMLRLFALVSTMWDLFVHGDSRGDRAGVVTRKLLDALLAPRMVHHTPLRLGLAALLETGVEHCVDAAEATLCLRAVSWLNVVEDTDSEVNCYIWARNPPLILLSPFSFFGKRFAPCENRAKPVLNPNLLNFSKWCRRWQFGDGGEGTYCWTEFELYHSLQWLVFGNLDTVACVPRFVGHVTLSRKRRTC